MVTGWGGVCSADGGAVLGLFRGEGVGWGGWGGGGGRGMFKCNGLSFHRSSVRLILNVMGLSCKVTVPAVFQTLGRV